jgi:hypothetical protein
MRTKRLRHIASRYGTAGLLLAGSCLLFWHLCRGRAGRRSLSVAGIVCLLAVVYGWCRLPPARVAYRPSEVAPYELRPADPGTPSPARPAPPDRQAELSRWAKRLLVNDNWDWDFAYHWLSNDDLLLMREAFSGDGSERYYRVNAWTGRRVDMQGLNAAMEEPGRSAAPGWNVSPDGRWLVQHGRRWSNVVRLDGTGFRQVGGGDYHADIFWLGNSRHLLHFWWGTNGQLLEWPAASVYSINRPLDQNGGAEPVANPKNSVRKPLYSQDTLALSSVGDAVYTFAAEPGHEREGKTVTHAFIREWRSLGHNASPHLVTVGLPAPGHILEAKFSTRCEAVAWLQVAPREKSVASPSGNDMQGEDWNTALVCVCAADGSDVRVVGSLTVGREGDSTYTVEDPHCLRWLPDGKRLSFICDDALWITNMDATRRR